MTERRIRDVYADYQKGLVSFDDVVKASDEFLDGYARTRQQTETASLEARAAHTPRREV